MIKLNLFIYLSFLIYVEVIIPPFSPPLILAAALRWQNAAFEIDLMWLSKFKFGSKISDSNSVWGFLRGRERERERERANSSSSSGPKTFIQQGVRRLLGLILTMQDLILFISLTVNDFWTSEVNLFIHKTLNIC